MKITINIPKEFEEHFNSDRFKYSLLRLCCDAQCLAGDYEKKLAIMLIVAFENAEVESDEQHDSIFTSREKVSRYERRLDDL